jgi:hypothetical protein
MCTLNLFLVELRGIERLKEREQREKLPFAIIALALSLAAISFCDAKLCKSFLQLLLFDIKLSSTPPTRRWMSTSSDELKVEIAYHLEERKERKREGKGSGKRKAFRHLRVSPGPQSQLQFRFSLQAAAMRVVTRLGGASRPPALLGMQQHGARYKRMR